MVTKGIITSIDFNGNTCQVRIPFFETAGNDPITGTAIISNTPGSYNGYKVGDVVLVAFEDGMMNNPVIMGKLYLGAAKEKADPRGAISVENVVSANSATLPADAILTARIDSNIPNTTVPYASLSSIANGLNAATRDLGQLDRFVNNQFESVISDADGLRTAIRQNSAAIALEAEKRAEDDAELSSAITVEAGRITSEVERASEAEGTLSTRIDQTEDAIENSVVHIDANGETNGLGWHLDTDNWTLNKIKTGTSTEILKANEDGLTVHGTIYADAGQIAGWTIAPDKLTSGQGSGAVSIQSDGSGTEFTAAEYIQSSGSQYIDTGLIVDNNTSIEVVVQEVSPSLAVNSIFGGKDGKLNYTTGSDYYGGYLYYAASGTPVGQTSLHLSEKTTIKVDASNAHKLIRSSDTVFVDDVYSISSTAFIESATLLLFARNNSGPSDFGYVKLYSCKIWQNGNLIRNYIPVCKHGVFGLYDLINKEFKSSASSTQFSGALKEELSPIYEKNGVKYQRLEYIQNNGTNNYIDLDWVPNYSAGFEVTIVYSPTASTDGDSNRAGLISNYDATKNLSLEIAGGARFYANNADLGTMPGVLVNRKNTSIFTFKNNTWINTLNGVSDSGTATITGQSESGVRLFCDKYNGGRFTTFKVPIKIYSILIKENGNIVHNYLPAKCTSGTNINKVGVLDLATGNFFACQGDTPTYNTAELAGGETFTADGHSYRVVKYIESYGQEYIDTGYIPKSSTTFNVTYQTTKQSAITDAALMGYRQANSNGGAFIIWARNAPADANAELFALNVNETTYIENHSCPNQWQKHIVNLTGGNASFDGGVLSASSIPSLTNENNITLVLFGVKAGSVVDQRHFYGKLYECSIYENNVLVKHYIPVLEDENEYGLWETVNNYFYGNNGSGAFTGETYPYEFDSIYLGSEESTSAPFRVTNTGKLFATEADISGTVNATSGSFTGTITANDGKIGGFKIDATKLYSGTIGDSLSVLMSPGHTDIISTLTPNIETWAFTAGQNFGVTTDGEVFAKNINAIGGKIGGFDIQNNQLYTSSPISSTTGEISIKPTSIIMEGIATTTDWSTMQKNAYYMGIDPARGQNGLGVFGSKMTRVYSAYTSGSWWSPIVAEVAGIRPFEHRYGYSEVPNLIVIKNGTLGSSGRETINFANWESGIVERVLGASIHDTCGNASLGFYIHPDDKRKIDIIGGNGYTYFAAIYCYAATSGPRS